MDICLRIIATVVLVLLVAVATVQCAYAGDYRLIFHGLSNHLDTDVWFDEDGNEHDFNEVNPGIGVAYEWIDHVDLRAGVFRNSFDKTSIYAGAGWHTSYKRPLSFILQAGIVSGYQDTPTGGDSELIGYAMPTVGLNVKRVRVELGYIPKISDNEGDSSVITLSLAVRL